MSVSLSTAEKLFPPDTHFQAQRQCIYSVRIICTGCYKQENCGKINPWLRCFVSISFIQNVSLNVVIQHTVYIPNQYTQRREKEFFYN